MRLGFGAFSELTGLQPASMSDYRNELEPRVVLMRAEREPSPTFRRKALVAGDQTSYHRVPPTMKFSPILAIVLAATLVVSAEFVAAQRPLNTPSSTPRKPIQGLMPDAGREPTGPVEKPTPSRPDPTKQLLAIIEQQETLIKALRARIKELEQANTVSPSPAPTEQ
jgi:hypothetical protein